MKILVKFICLALLSGCVAGRDLGISSRELETITLDRLQKEWPKFNNKRIRVIGYLDGSSYGPYIDDCFRPKDNDHPDLLTRGLLSARGQLLNIYGHEVVVEGLFRYKTEPAGGEWDVRPPPLTDELIGPLFRTRIVSISDKTCPYIQTRSPSDIESTRKMIKETRLKGAY